MGKWMRGPRPLSFASTAEWVTLLSVSPVPRVSRERTSSEIERPPRASSARRRTYCRIKFDWTVFQWIIEIETWCIGDCLLRQSRVWPVTLCVKLEYSSVSVSVSCADLMRNAIVESQIDSPGECLYSTAVLCSDGEKFNETLNAGLDRELCWRRRNAFIIIWYAVVAVRWCMLQVELEF